jgi:transcriptional regulator with XRE-family HTH domain
MTRGRRSLIGLLQITSQREVAARCDVVPSCVSEWCAGYKRPSEAHRARLASLYGISINSWDDERSRPRTRHDGDRS